MPARKGVAYGATVFSVLIRLVFLFAVVGQVAGACPTGADLASGIRIIDGDGAVEVVQDLGNGVVAQEIDFGGGEIAKNQLIKGVYVSKLTLEVDGVIDLSSLLEVTYDRPPAAMSPPTPGLVNRFQTTVTDTTSSYVEVQEHRWGEVAPFSIGACTFDSLEGQIRYVSEVSTIVETVRYLPELGIGILTAYAYGDETPEIYELVSIEAVQ